VSHPPPEPAGKPDQTLSPEQVAELSRRADAEWRESRESVTKARGTAPRIPANAIAVVLLLVVGCITLLVVGQGASGGGTTTTAPAQKQAPFTPAPPVGLPPQFFG
jgi:hypothetical protein